MLYLTCTTITSIDLAHYGVSRAKDLVSVKCGTICPFTAMVGLTCRGRDFKPRSRLRKASLLVGR